MTCSRTPAENGASTRPPSPRSSGAPSPSWSSARCSAAPGLAAGITVGALLAQEMLGARLPGGPPGGAVHARRRRWQRSSSGGSPSGSAGVPAWPRVRRRRARRARRRRRGRDRQRAAPAGVPVRLRRRHRDEPAGPLRGHRPGPPTQRGTAISSRWCPRPSARSPARTWSGRSAGSRSSSGYPPSRARSCSRASAYLAAGAVLFALLRPDPFLVARRLEAQDRRADRRRRARRPGRAPAPWSARR